MAINKVEFSGDTLIDLTEDTVTPDTLAKGVTAHSRSGEIIYGEGFIPQELIDQVEQNTNDINELSNNKADKSIEGKIGNYEKNGFLSKNLYYCGNISTQSGSANYNLKAGKYTMSCGNISGDSVIKFTAADGTEYRYANQLKPAQKSFSFELPKDIVKFDWYLYSGSSITDIQIEYGEVATSYTAFALSNVELNDRKLDKSGGTMTGNLSVPSISDNDYNKIILNNEDIECHTYGDGSGFEIYGYPNLGGNQGLVLRVRPSQNDVGAVVTNGVGKININAPNGLLLNGFELKKTVPADAKFTDTTYEQATSSKLGLTKLYSSATGSNTDGAPTQNAVNSAIVPIASDVSTIKKNIGSHTVKTDVPENAVFTDTTYNVATASSNGLMSADDKARIDSIGTVITGVSPSQYECVAGQVYSIASVIVSEGTWLLIGYGILKPMQLWIENATTIYMGRNNDFANINTTTTCMGIVTVQKGQQLGLTLNMQCAESCVVYMDANYCGLRAIRLA